MKVEARGLKIYFNGVPKFLIGVNYWPRKHPIWRMWKEFDEREIDEELKQMREFGINAVRFFIFGEDFFPSEDRIRPDSLEKLRKFLDLCHKHGIAAFPTLLVGHMSGENWPIPPLHGLDLYRDPKALRLQAWFVSRIICEFRDHPAVAGWILSNELPYYAGKVDFDTAKNYTAFMSSVVKSVDRQHLFGTGDGLYPDTGFTPENIAEYVDYLGPHVYYGGDNDPVAASYRYGFAVNFSSSLGKATILEEYGCSTVVVSEKRHAMLIRLGAFATLINKGFGVFPWCFSDFPNSRDRPYVHHPIELGFGLTRRDGSPKPAAEELKRFSNIVSKIDWERFTWRSCDAAIVTPSHTYRSYEFIFTRREDTLETLLHSYIFASSAHIPIEFVREEELEDRIWRYKLVIVPSIKEYCATTWEAIEEFVKSGGTALLIYAYEMWCHRFRGLTGVVTDHVYGVVETLSGRLKLEGVYEGFTVATDIAQFPHQLNKPELTYCKVDKLLDGAQVAFYVESSEGKFPAVIVNGVGDGKCIFSTLPLEAYAREVPAYHMRFGGYVIYEFAKTLAGIRRTVEVKGEHARFVEIGELVSEDGKEVIAVLLNHHPHSDVKVSLQINGDVEHVEDFESGKRLSSTNMLEVSIGPWDARVIRIVLR